MHHPNPRRKPPAREPAAAAGQGRSRGRRPRPGPPGSTYKVQVLGGGAGRRLAQEQTEAAAAVLAWLAARPPTHAHRRDRVGRHRRQRQACRAEHGDASRDAAGPAEPGRGSGREHADRIGRARGRADTQASWAGPVRRPGRSGGWRVVVELSDGGSGPGGGAGGSGPAGRGGRTGVGVHPAAVRRWVWHAWRGWGTAMGMTQSDSPDPPG